MINLSVFDSKPSPSLSLVKTAFTIPEWADFGLAGSKFSSSDMSRHFFILGETGAGKTFSGILPILNAGLRFASDDSSIRPFIFIIDPKHELVDNLQGRDDLRNRLVEFSLSKDEYKLDFFEGHDRSTLTSEEVVDRVSTLFFEQSLADKDRFWENRASVLIRLLVQIDLDLTKKGLTFWASYLDAAEAASDLNKLFEDRATGLAMSAGDFSSLCRSRGDRRLENDDNYFFRVKQFIGLVNTHRAAAFGVLNLLVENNDLSPSYVGETMPFSSMAMETFGSISSFATKSIDRLSSDEVNRHIWFSPHSVHPKVVSINDMMSQGKILIYHPGDVGVVAGSLVGKCIKSKVFEMVFYRTDKKRFVMYFCDEFQRFITNDPISGEQSFLDRCRAYRTVCVLATQSIASLSYTLGLSGEHAASTSIDILMTNTGNKLFFRSTDVNVKERLRSLLPHPSAQGKSHIVEVRPPATLSLGECYYTLSSGRWGRKSVRILPEEEAHQ